MNDKTKRCNGCQPPTPIALINTSNNTSSTQLKLFITTLAVWGLFPIRLADWINRIGENNDE